VSAWRIRPQPALGPRPQGFQKTGLGERVANMFVAACGKSTLGLAYGLSVAEALLAPAMPSTTARAGGIFMPIINSLSLAADSKPGAPLLQGMAEVGMPHQAGGVARGRQLPLSTVSARPPTASPVRQAALRASAAPVRCRAGRVAWAGATCHGGDGAGPVAAHQRVCVSW